MNLPVTRRDGPLFFTLHTKQLFVDIEERSLRVDIADLEKAEQQIDQFLERRAREAKDADVIEDLWAEQDRRERSRRREANRADWIAYHGHMNAVHSSLAADHADRRSRLLLEAGTDGPSGEAA